MLALIGSKWLDSRNEAGGRRLDDPNDFVRREVKAGLSRNIAVIPILIDDAQMPKESDLPDDLRPLVRRQNYRITYENFRRDVDELKTQIRKNLRKSWGWIFWVSSSFVLLVILLLIMYYLK